MADVAYGTLPFREQIEFLRRKTNITTQAWTDLWQEDHDIGFMVAGANRIDLVADFHEAVNRIASEGATLADFRKDFDRIVAKYGWDYNGGRNWRSRVIYETNLRTSYAAGRFQQLQALKKVRPYWLYVHADGELHPRPMHKHWGEMRLTLKADDPWWHTHYPPNGWGCRCRVRALNERDLKRMGITPSKAPNDGTHTVTIGQRSGDPREVTVPNGVDPGFGYTPGRSTYENLTQDVVRKAAQLPAATSAAALEQLLAIKRTQEALDATYEAFQREVMATRQARNAAVQVGALEPDLVAAMKAVGLEPETAPITARDVEVLHTLRDGKTTAHTGKMIALTAEELSHLPALLRTARAVLLDRANETLLFAVDASTRREIGKLVVHVNYRLKTTKSKVVTNSFRTASLLDLIDLRAEVESGKLTLLLGSLK